MRSTDSSRRPPMAFALAIALVLGACTGRSEADSADAAANGASGPATASRSPIGIVPTAADSAGSGVPGPGAGATAVGGVAGGQDGGGAAKSSGSPPAPTGGDGAASASLK